MTIVFWYRDQWRNFGWARATWLLWRVAWRRIYVLIVNKTLPRKLTCPCCGWEGHRYLDYLEMGYMARNSACPRCDSHPRHRGLFLWLERDYQISERKGTALIFAPERSLFEVWLSAADLTCVRLDIEATRDVDLIADITSLPIDSNVADLIWCHHVLEQVVDDVMALSELRRVLKPITGQLIISAGETRAISTREFGAPNKALSGNRRAYGADFKERLVAAGFNALPMSYSLTASERKQFGIDDERFYLCTTTSIQEPG
jgi:SAM-dependent methyltransferase